MKTTKNLVAALAALVMVSVAAFAQENLTPGKYTSIDNGDSEYYVFNANGTGEEHILTTPDKFTYSVDTSAKTVTLSYVDMKPTTLKYGEMCVIVDDDIVYVRKDAKFDEKAAAPVIGKTYNGVTFNADGTASARGEKARYVVDGSAEILILLSEDGGVFFTYENDGSKIYEGGNKKKGYKASKIGGFLNKLSK